MSHIEISFSPEYTGCQNSITIFNRLYPTPPQFENIFEIQSTPNYQFCSSLITCQDLEEISRVYRETYQLCLGETYRVNLQCSSNVPGYLLGSSYNGYPQIDGATFSPINYTCLSITADYSSLSTSFSIPFSSSEDDGLSGGAIAGIVIAVIIVIIIIIIVVIFVVKKKKQNSPGSSSSSNSNSSNSDVSDDSSS